ncbi:hypothetical protein [uncultured Microscilla sp.]|uniref:hypothetical protein n=1 Tax=uncultured Microscilla sp. TaxID=432653 RepID=UPI00263335FD|nr:hypothetical protein [uncultured Microscilla sp.]
MKKLIVYIFLVGLWACLSNAEKYALFDRDKFADHILTVSIDKVPTLEKFNQTYWAKNSLKVHTVVLIPYDFANQRFGNSKTTTVIPLSALSWSASLHRTSLELYPDAQGKVYNQHKELLSSTTIKKMFQAHLLNRGKNPKLAESPQKAWVDIFMPPQQSLHSIAPLLGVLAEAYTETLASTHNLAPDLIKHLLYLRKRIQIKKND